MIDGIKPLFHGCKILAVKFTVGHVLRHIPVIISQQIIDLGQLPLQFFQPGINSGHTAQCTQSPAYRTSCTVLKIAPCILIAVRKAFRYLFAVHHKPVALLQIIVLSWYQLRLLYLLQLKFRQRLFLCLGLLIHCLFFQPPAKLPALFISGFHFLCHRQKFLPTKSVQYLHMLFLV